MALPTERRKTIQSEKYQFVSMLKKSDSVEVAVYRHVQLNQLRVIKSASADSETGLALLREARLIQTVHITGIPAIYDIDESEQRVMVIEEYIPGESLYSCYLKNHLKDIQILSLMLQLCDITSSLHMLPNPVLHLDLKPQNIILSNGRVFLLDFGSAKLKNPDGKAEEISGTPGYCAPECYQGIATEQSDIYSLGKILMFLLGKRRQKESYARKYLYGIAQKASRDKVTERYLNVREFKKSLLKAGKKGKALLAEEAVIFIAGSQRRCAVTSTALRMAQFYKKMGKKVLYLECNENEVVSQIFGENSKKSIEQYQGIAMAESRFTFEREVDGDEWLREKEYYRESGYSVIICDFGVMAKEKASYARASDYAFLVSGCLDWELESLMKSICLGKDIEGLILLLQAGNPENAEKLRKNLSRMNVYVLPDRMGTEGIWDDFENLFRELFTL